MSPAEALATLIRVTPASERPALAAELARGLATVFGLMTATVSDAASGQTRPAGGGTAPLLTVHEAAERLGVQPTWLYRHSRNLPFTKKIGHRTLRFDSSGLERWAASRGPR